MTKPAITKSTRWNTIITNPTIAICAGNHTFRDRCSDVLLRQLLLLQLLLLLLLLLIIIAVVLENKYLGHPCSVAVRQSPPSSPCLYAPPTRGMSEKSSLQSWRDYARRLPQANTLYGRAWLDCACCAGP